MLPDFSLLAHDNTSGATELVRRLVALCEACTLGHAFDAVREGLKDLEQYQRSMPSFHAVLHILQSDFLLRLQEEDVAGACAYLQSLQHILDESSRFIASHLAERLPSPVSILTLSRSSTVIAALMSLHDRKQITRLSVLESRPVNEGIRTARDCADYGIPTTLYTDAAMVDALAGIDCCVMGADSVSADGYLLNKTGSHPLALCSRHAGIPTYVLCDSLKFSPQLRDDIVVEERDPSEVHALGKDDRFAVINRYFEWVPVDIVTAFITERGVFSPRELSRLSQEDSITA